MPDPITPRQKAILEFLRKHAQQHAYPPTVREIGLAVGLSSSSTVQNHLNTLEAKGYIRRDPTKSRTVEVTDGEGLQERAARVLSLPLVGRVAAGSPVLAAENIDDYVAVGPEIAGDDASFLLTVTGDSMIEAGIYDGDLVVVRPRREAPPNGTIVVARIENEMTGEGEVTVKRFYKEASRIRLQPENAALQPIYVRDLELEGVVTAVIRVIR
ncbi:MAG TPA: transcriptional repressor LexA [Candidatus Sulfotelmatobacter sp.]|nr:transcriptional repressor LexA [Candidatus Sulfotelmatobacter sp.]